MRNLVTIRTVQRILPIEGADRIELAVIDGWQCIVKKGEFVPGSMGVFFEIDSMLPSADPRFAFMDASKFRVKSKKMKGVISQGLLLPVSQFTSNELMNLDLIGVTKYEPPIPSAGQGVQKGTFPVFVPRTDLERIQNLPAIIQHLNLLECEITEKLDGCSFTAWHNNGATGCASRNWEVNPEIAGWWANVYNTYDLKTKLTTLGRNIAIQGEILGPGIQGNRYKQKDLTLYIFDVYDIDMQRYMEPSERIQVVNDLGLIHVPVIPFTSMTWANPLTMESLIAMADGTSQLSEHPREGLAIKGPGVRFKVISNSWLLKFE